MNETAPEIQIRDRIDYKDPGPQVVRKGRLHRLLVEIYVPVEATPDEIADYVGFELGFGSLDDDHPLADGGFDLRRVEHVEDSGLEGFTLWNAVGEGCEPNARQGRTVHRPVGAPLDFAYEAPQGKADAAESGSGDAGS